MSKTAAILFLKEQLVSAEYERKKAQAAQAVAARLPQLDAEVQALKLLLAKHTRATDHVKPPSQLAHRIDPVVAVSSVSKLTVRALTEAGKPQTTAQLLGFLASHGKRTTSATLRSTIWLSANKGRLFKVVAPGVYGLVEWEDTRQ